MLYKDDYFAQEEAPLVQAVGAVYDASLGEHPAFWSSVFSNLPSFEAQEVVSSWKEAGLPFQMCFNGHNVMRLDDRREIPLSPLFVRDLSGRIVYTGLGPEVKEASEWALSPAITFPKGCADVTAAVPGAEKIEQVFFTGWRALDVALKSDTALSGQNGLYQPQYDARNLYPYKLRLDSFYADGWRLPQVEAVYARPVKERLKAQSLADKLMQRWAHRAEGQSYMAFYEENNGDTLVEQLFVQGVTLIPTFEGCNGFNKVGKNFELEDFWPGRAVKGLHEIVEARADKAPKGTIIDVLEPGYVTVAKVKPARVVVSDGSGYTSPHKEDPAPLQPDLRLPHTRLRAVWNQAWLPTHPSHFEAPSLWGWDDATGRFLQFSGPVWDPLHYFYASVSEVWRVVRQSVAGQACEVPAKMMRRFYPVQAMPYYETLSVPTLEARKQAYQPVLTAVDQVPLKDVCGVGYHPLPLMYEDELDVFAFPELAPKYRLQGKAPSEKELMPVIQSAVTPEQAKKATMVTPLTQNLKEEKHFKAPTGELLNDYPQLERYLVGKSTEENLSLVPLWLRDVPESELQRNIRRAVGGQKFKTQLEAWQKGLFQGYSDFRERALWWRRLRHRLFRKYPGWYVRGYWQLDFPEKTAENGRKMPHQGAKSVRQRLGDLSTRA